MANPRRGLPDVFVTSITGLLAGDADCHFSPWYRARYWLKNDDPNFDKAAWVAEHTEMLAAHVRLLRAEGWAHIFVEKQNLFSWIGKTAKLTGKPDILAFRDEPARLVLVSDVKTGQRKSRDYHQVLEYMVALPYVRPDMEGYAISGELVYRDGRVEIAPHEAAPAVRKQVTSLLCEMGFGMPPEKTPSTEECRYCPLSSTDCPDRCDTPRATGLSEEF